MNLGLASRVFLYPHPAQNFAEVNSSTVHIPKRKHRIIRSSTKNEIPLQHSFSELLTSIKLSKINDLFGFSNREISCFLSKNGEKRRKTRFRAAFRKELFLFPPHSLFLIKEKALSRRIQDLGIILFEKDIRTLEAEELKFHFGSARSGRIVLTRVMKSIIWQAHKRIKAQEEPPVIGNLRTFFYRFVKPTLEAIPDNTFRKDPYDVMLQTFEEMVMDEQLFRYQDFDLTDENWQNRHIGTTAPHILIFAEKTGWSRFLRRWNEDLGVSTLALGGFPSALSSEYTVNALHGVISKRKKVHLLGIVDYDPSGWSIANSFANQLSVCGLKTREPVLFIHPKHYQPEEIDLFTFRLPKRQPTKQAKWLTLSGGIEGEAMGLESESMPLERIDRLLREEVKKILS